MATTTIPQVVIVDYGSQYTQLIARSLRELEIRSAVLPLEYAEQWLKEHRPKAIILSGGNNSVTDHNAPRLPQGIFTQQVPILGVCYGMQLLVHSLGGAVQSVEGHAEYGPTRIKLEKNPLFRGIDAKHTVWASHTDTVSSLPKGFDVIAQSEKYPYAGIFHKEKQLWAVQFHPEVADTTCGKNILKNFIFNIADCKKDWLPENLVTNIQESLKSLSTTDKVLIGFSGGVDSTVLAAIMSPILKERLIAICIDGNHLREGEIDIIEKHALAAGTTVSVIDASEAFQQLVRDTTDAELKRGAFRKIYKKIFEDTVRKEGITHIAQGTLATDLIESGETGGALIKTHHNSNLDFSVSELAPLSDLFKYEVRELAKTLNLPASVSGRPPFPGPGLFVRIIGAPATTERLNLLRRADTLVSKIISDAGLTQDISQLVVALNCSKTVGVKGDVREYGYNVIVRAVKTIDFMTVEGVQLPPEIRRIISERIPQISGITRVFYDETNKPPATTEFE